MACGRPASHHHRTGCRTLPPPPGCRCSPPGRGDTAASSPVGYSRFWLGTQPALHHALPASCTQGRAVTTTPNRFTGIAFRPTLDGHTDDHPLRDGHRSPRLDGYTDVDRDPRDLAELV